MNCLAPLGRGINAVSICKVRKAQDLYLRVIIKLFPRFLS